MRTFVIGDIHGGYRALIQCLARSGFNKEEDRLISLGDIADGWSETPECVEELLSIKNLIAIRGNHDVWCDEWLQYKIAPNMWLHQGGKATYDAYTIHHPDLIDKHQIEFFSKQHNYYVDDSNRGFVHGGFTSRKGLGHEPYHTNYFWDRDLWGLAKLSHRFYERNIKKFEQSHYTRFLKHKEIFIGHSSTMMYNIVYPMHKCNVWNVDTGGGFNGKLTIMDIDSKEYWQSDFVKDLYPEEKGR